MKLILFLFLAIIPNISAQEDTTEKQSANEKQFFLSMGFGSGTYGSHLGYALQFITNSHAFAARFMDCSKFDYGETDQCPSSNATEFGLLYGYSRLFRYKYFMPNMIQVQAGLSIAKETTVTYTVPAYPVDFCNPSTEEIKHPIGFAYNIEAIQTILPVLGVGFNIYGSLNTSKSIKGINLRVYLGKLY